MKKIKEKYRRSACILIFTAAVIAALVSGTVYARYIKSSQKLENSFSRAEYDNPTISDKVSADTDGLLFKSSVTVTAGEHDYPVYVRVSLIVTWQDEQGGIYGQSPEEGIDYTLEYNDVDWTLGSDGYYYCNKPVSGGEETPPLIDEGQMLKQVSDSPDGYTMHAEVVAETIQAVGETDEDGNTAVMDAWQVQPYTLNEVLKQ